MGRRIPIPHSDFIGKARNPHRDQMISRLKHLRGSWLTSPAGVEGMICEHGLWCVRKHSFVLYHDMTEVQLSEVLRDNESHVRYADEKGMTQGERDKLRQEYLAKVGKLTNKVAAVVLDGKPKTDEKDTWYVEEIIGGQDEEVPF